MFASRFHRVCGWLFLLVAAPVAVIYAIPQHRQAINSAILASISPSRAAAKRPVHAAIRPIALHAALQGTPYLSLRDGAAVATNYVGDSSATGMLRSNLAQPLALASADFDSDGVPDLVSGYAAGNGGIITIHRGNVDALWPYGAALRNGEPPVFLPNALALKVPEPPDFIGVGDFDADGHWDIVTAHAGSSAMYFLRGDGHGNFGTPQRIAVSGSITAFTTGEINRADGLTDIVVGVTDANGSQALVYESPLGAIKATPETFALPAPATSMVLGMVEGGPMRDLAIGAGNQLIVVHGRDRQLSLGSAAQNNVAQAKVTQQVLPFAVKALALGHFSDTSGLAALGDDGAIHLMQNSNAIMRLMNRLSAPPTAQPVMATHGGGASNSKPLRGPSSGKSRTAERAALLQTMRQAMSGGAAEWKVAATVAAPATAITNSASLARQFVAAHVSTSQYDDLLLLDNQANQVHVLSSRTTRTAIPATAGARASVKVVSQPMSLAASLDAGGSPAAVLPMRVNQHGLKSLVMLQTGQSAPVISQQTPANIFTVTSTLDIATSSLTASVPSGSLRAALINAQNSGGTAEIVFNIPTSDPGYNAATGVFLIQPLSVVPPGNDDDFALPPSSETVTIDGYTQPGASPNTLTIGDNAKPVIQIDGGMAITPGGVALELFDTIGAVIRGFIVTGWSVTDSSNPSTPTGGIGLADGGVSDYIEGNFVGVDSSGVSTKGNLEGVNIDNGPIFGLTGPGEGGNIFGGTTPQARNIVSGNTDEGIVAAPDSFFLQIQGNYVGTDRTGTIGVLNVGDGVFVPGEEVTVGGVLPGAGNLISGNTNYNLSIGNGVPSHSAVNVTAQGNFIGTDVTGTVALPAVASGVGIVNEASNVTVGGTTPSARNVISGNNFIGIEVADDSFNVVIQGNYIGLDITGTKAIANGSGLTGENNIPSGGIALDTHTFISGTPVLAPPFNVAIGGTVAGSGNVISGNNGDGISIMGFDNNDPNGFNPTNLSNFVMGNFVGTDSTGANAVPNSQNGLYLLMDAEASSPAMNNAIGGSAGGAGNTFAFNTMNGVLIDGTSSKNPIVGNTIQHNGGTGVRVVTGTGNAISRNSIFGNGALGIDLGTAGPNANSNCQTTATGANNSQNAPILTAGSGATFVSATATDPNGNTSEFSNSVASSLSGNILTLLGNFNSLPSTTYTIEFFSSPSADPSGFGQGQTFVASSSVTTASTCAAPISNPVNLTEADLSVTMTYKSTVVDETQNQLAPGPDFGNQIYTAVVTNNGAATAHNVVLTDPLPATLAVSNTYCNLATCQSPITTTVGGCTVSANTVTCNLGTLTVGQSVTVSIPVQALTTGSISNTVSATATETDPNPANNTATVTITSQNPFTQILQITPAGLLTSSPDTQVIIGGTVFLPGVTTVTFTDPNNVATVLPVTAFFANQTCGFNSNVSTAMYCQGLQVTLPHSLIGTAGAASFTVSNPGQPFTVGPMTFTLANTCTFGVPFVFIDLSDGGGILELDSSFNVPGCTTTATSDSPWIVALDSPAPDQFSELVVDFAVAPNTGAARTGNITFGGNVVAVPEPAGTGDTSVCTYTLNPPSATISSVAGNYTVQLIPNNQSCEVDPESFAPWMTVANAFLSGTVTLNYSVTANTGGPRTGSLSMGNLAFPVMQNASSSCFFTLSSNSANFPTAAGTGSVNVIASLPTCPWTASNDSPSFVTITSGASGTGNGTIQYSVAANTAGGRNANLTIANSAASSVTYAITQASLFACAATLSPATFNAPAEGASNGFLINLSLNQCSWNAVSNNPSDLTITSANAGTGSQAAIAFAVAQNTSTSPRTLTITAGCQTFTVIQAGSGVTNPVPTITSLSPTGVVAGSGTFTLTVNGTGFVSGAVVNFNGAATTTTFVSSTVLTASIPATAVATVGTPPVTVTNPAPGGGTSAVMNFSVTAASNPVATITSLVPGGATAGGAAFTLIVNGTNLISTSVVNFNGSPRVTTFVSGGQVTAAITAADIATASTSSITVTNPAPGGGTSTGTPFIVANPVPTVSALLPASGLAGGAAFTLTVNGTGFVSGSVVNFGGAAKVTTFVTSTQVTAAILATDITTTGTPSVTVTNPGPGGGTSSGVPFQINNPVPTISSLLPNTIAAGSASFTLTVNGTNFVNGSRVTFNGDVAVTTFVNSTQLTATILPVDVATAGTPAVTVTNLAPGGGTSAAATFTVTAATNPAPTITSLSPNTIAAGSAGFTLVVNGTNFISTSVVNFNGTARTTTFINASQLTIPVSATDVATVGTPAVTVTNPAPGGGTSAAATFTITAANNPVPTITSLSPNTIAAGSIAFTLTVNGTNFVSNSVVHFNGAAKVTTFVSSTVLTAQIQSLDVETAGNAAVFVSNPTPGGGSSSSLNFTISSTTNPAPTITSISPNSLSAGSAGFTLTVTGSNFISNSVVQWNGSPRVTTFVNATTLTAAITAADILTANLDLVSVVNPTPGGGTSNAVTFTVTTPVPSLGSLVPNSAIAGTPAFTMTVNGGNFINTSEVQWNGANLTTTFVSATQLTATVPATDIASVGTASVTVFTPTIVFSGIGNARAQGAPSGTTSNALTFTINPVNPVPTLTALSPSSASAGSVGFTMTLTGTNFIASSVAHWNGAALATTFVSSTQLTAAVPASDLAFFGIASVDVINPTPGGGTSNTLTFTITTPVPVLASLSPSSATAAGPAFTLTLNGSNFISTSVAQWKGSTRTTTFVSATQLTAAITAADIATAGTASVTVFTPTEVAGGIGGAQPAGAPSGTTSNALTFTINADFSVTPTTTTETVTAGQSTNFTIATAPIGGSFPGTITFTASGLPAGATASFTPASVSAGTSTSMTVTTTARPTLGTKHVPFTPNSPARPLWLIAFAMMLALATLTLSKFGRRNMRRLIPIGALALLLISAAYLSGCNGGFPELSKNTGTPAGTYTITVTGTSGADVHSTTVTLVVQ